MKSITEIKKMSKEEFLTLPGAFEELYDSLQKSKSGWITIHRDYDGAGEHGWTEAFGEGLSCKVNNTDRWYITSVIESIDWDNQTFKTRNSIYEFEFIDSDKLNSDNTIENANSKN